MRVHRVLSAAILAVVVPAAAARAPGEPIRLVWDEGDVAGMTTIYGPEADTPIGVVEYHQVRRGDLLHSVRAARFRDGSSDEDVADARVAGTLEAVGGRTVIRDADGEAIVALDIDVAGGRVSGHVGRGARRTAIEKRLPLPPATYWGPLVFVALKNFEANAEDGRLVFHTVAATPHPRGFDLELVRLGPEVVERAGSRLASVRFALRPTVHWTIDPLLRLVLPDASFWVLLGEPPALARFAGPRNFARQRIRIE